MLVHLSDNKLNSYRSKEDFLWGNIKKKWLGLFWGIRNIEAQLKF